MFLTQVPKALSMRPEAQVWPYPGDTPAASVGGDTHRPCSGIRKVRGRAGASSGCAAGGVLFEVSAVPLPGLDGHRMSRCQ